MPHSGDERGSLQKGRPNSLSIRMRRMVLPLIMIASIAVSHVAFDSATKKTLAPRMEKETSLESDPASASSASNIQHRTASSNSNLRNSHLQALPSPEIVNQDVIVNGHSYSLSDPRLLPYLPLKKPILVAGMPKAGTTTIYSFFRDAGYKSSHYYCKEDQGIEKLNCGFCIRDAIQDNLPPLKTCGDYDVWAQMDVTYLPDYQIYDCYYPQILAMEELHMEAPNATIILNRRNLDRWVSSLQRWSRISMAHRLTKCKEGPASESVEDLQEWHKNHIQAIRRFVQKYPSHALVEIDIEDPMAAKRMAKLFKVKESLWGRKNAN